jgi:hypothetical protein
MFPYRYLDFLSLCVRFPGNSLDRIKDIIVLKTFLFQVIMVNPCMGDSLMI